MKRNVLLMCFSIFFLLALTAVPATAADWQLRMVRLGADDWAAMKFDAETGDAWRASAGKWIHCGEDGAVPHGRYDIAIVSGDADWYAVRINITTGQSWELGEIDWVSMVNE